MKQFWWYITKFGSYCDQCGTEALSEYSVPNCHCYQQPKTKDIMEEYIISNSPTERLVLIVYSNNSIGIETQYLSSNTWKTDSSDRNIFLSEEEIIKIKEVLFG